MTNREKVIALVDNDRLKKSDAIVLLEGDGLNRYPKAVELYKAGWADKIVFSGGVVNRDYGSFPFLDVLPHILKTGVPAEAVLHEGNSQNTREQAVEMVKLSRENRWTRLILVGTHEHQYRAYLTFLREALDSRLGLILYNAPTRELDWFSQTGWGMRIERLEQEFERIEKYSALGHLATFEEAIEYQKWKEAQK